MINISTTITAQSVFSWFVTLLMPFILILTAVRLLLTPLFVKIEYRTPNFPPDPYGFSLSDRVKWASLSLDYLLNDEGVDFLENLTFEGGSPIYNERELKHMVDVKNVVKGALNVWIGALVIAIFLGIVAYKTEKFNQYLFSIRRGSLGTIGIVIAVIVFVLVGFGIFFVFFHEVFFDAGTWVFLYTDTLIRLFPERFWRDAFIWIGSIAILESLLIILVTKKMSGVI